jgi:hypothetical protein
VDQELTASILELLSIVAAGKRIKKPFQVPRPNHVKKKRRGQASAQPGADPYKQGVALLASTRHRRQVSA